MGPEKARYLPIFATCVRQEAAPGRPTPPLRPFTHSTQAAPGRYTSRSRANCQDWIEKAHALYKTFQRLGMSPSWYTFTKPLIDNLHGHPAFADACISLQRQKFGRDDVDIEVVFAHIRQVFELQASLPSGHAFQALGSAGGSSSKPSANRRNARDMSKCCQHHKIHGHDTSECRAIRNGTPSSHAPSTTTSQARQVTYGHVPTPYPMTSSQAPQFYSRFPQYQTSHVPYQPHPAPGYQISAPPAPATVAPSINTPSVNEERADAPPSPSFYTRPRDNYQSPACYLDSAAYPTHTPLPLHPNFATRSTTKLADGSLAVVRLRNSSRSDINVS